MIVTFKSRGNAAIETAALVAAAFRHAGLRPTIGLLGPTASQAIRLRALERRLAVRVVEEAEIDRASLSDPVILATSREGTLPETAAALRFACDEDACHAAAGPDGWLWRLEGDPMGLRIHCPAPGRAGDDFPLDPRACLFATHVITAEALRLTEPTERRARQRASEAASDFMLLGDIAAKITGMLEGTVGCDTPPPRPLRQGQARRAARPRTTAARAVFATTRPARLA